MFFLWFTEMACIGLIRKWRMCGLELEGFLNSQIATIIKWGMCGLELADLNLRVMKPEEYSELMAIAQGPRRGPQEPLSPALMPSSE